MLRLPRLTRWTRTDRAAATCPVPPLRQPRPLHTEPAELLRRFRGDRGGMEVRYPGGARAGKPTWPRAYRRRGLLVPAPFAVVEFSSNFPVGDGVETGCLVRLGTESEDLVGEGFRPCDKARWVGCGTGHRLPWDVANAVRDYVGRPLLKAWSRTRTTPHKERGRPPLGDAPGPYAPTGQRNSRSAQQPRQRPTRVGAPARTPSSTRR
jgi:hypothetical protein